jgi:hypothetical protein
MAKLNEVKKFTILTDIAENKARYADMTLDQMKEHLIKNFDATVTTGNLARWAKVYGFTYKSKRPKKFNQAEEIKRTNQRICNLSIVIRNLCKELDVQHPSILDKLISGITEQYETAPCFEDQTKELEDQIYESI